MNTPEPVDERPAAPVEKRGGDRDEDFMPEPQDWNQPLPFVEEDLRRKHAEDEDAVPAPLQRGH